MKHSYSKSNLNLLLAGGPDLNGNAEVLNSKMKRSISSSRFRGAITSNTTRLIEEKPTSLNATNKTMRFKDLTPPLFDIAAVCNQVTQRGQIPAGENNTGHFQNCVSKLKRLKFFRENVVTKLNNLSKATEQVRKQSQNLSDDVEYQYQQSMAQLQNFYQLQMKKLREVENAKIADITEKTETYSQLLRKTDEYIRKIEKLFNGIMNKQVLFESEQFLNDHSLSLEAFKNDWLEGFSVPKIEITSDKIPLGNESQENITTNTATMTMTITDKSATKIGMDPISLYRGGNNHHGLSPQILKSERPSASMNQSPFVLRDQEDPFNKTTSRAFIKKKTTDSTDRSYSNVKLRPAPAPDAFTTRRRSRSKEESVSHLILNTLEHNFNDQESSKKVKSKAQLFMKHLLQDKENLPTGNSTERRIRHHKSTERFSSTSHNHVKPIEQSRKAGKKEIKISPLFFDDGDELAVSDIIYEQDEDQQTMVKFRVYIPFGYPAYSNYFSVSVGKNMVVRDLIESLLRHLSIKDSKHHDYSLCIKLSEDADDKTLLSSNKVWVYFADAKNCKWPRFYLKTYEKFTGTMR